MLHFQFTFSPDCLGVGFCAFFSAVLAHIILRERLHIFGVLGCVLCVVGSIVIVLHAPQERQIESVKEVWDLATEPGFYSCTICSNFQVEQEAEAAEHQSTIDEEFECLFTH